MACNIIVSDEKDFIDISLANPPKEIENIEDIGKFKKNYSEQDLELIKEAVLEIIQEKIDNRKDLTKYLYKKRKEQKKQHSYSDLLYGLRLIFNENPNLEEYNLHLKKLFQKNSMRTESGVTVCATVMSPNPDGQEFTCKFDCSYCPDQPGQSRSYLKEEPGVLRANRNNFDPKEQLWDRLTTYFNTGHPTDKLEIIILGGTWSSYPKDYRMNYVKETFYAANNFENKLHEKDLPEIGSLEDELKINETCNTRIIGVTIETRPDQIDPEQLIEFRKLGVTRVQLGVQHTNERVLDRVNRRCKNKHTIKAIKALKNNCFKVDIHLMPDLPKPFKKYIHKNKKITIDDIDEKVNMVEEDKKMFDKVLSDPDFQADQWKIYPCEITPYTKIEKEYKEGLIKPYGEQEGREFNQLHELLIYVMSKVHPWIRLNRVIRDIPSNYIIGGNKDVSMRQTLQQEMKRRGLECKCIRAREVKKENIHPDDLELFVREYDASGGREYFISIETFDQKKILGFLRLRLSRNSGKFPLSQSYNKTLFPELINTALIRELHVYGQTIEVNNKNENYTQHKGYGKVLMNRAIDLAYQKGYRKIAVISGEGVKEYYKKKFGFRENNYFLTLNIERRIIHDKNSFKYKIRKMLYKIIMFVYTFMIDPNISYQELILFSMIKYYLIFMFLITFLFI